MTDSVKFQIGDIVEFVPDRERKGLVNGISFKPTGVIYDVIWDDMTEQSHYEMEIVKASADVTK
jgi:hypothetical protein